VGPDAHNAVREAADEAFASRRARAILSFDLGDSKTAVRFVPSMRECNGRLIMIVMDTRIVAKGAPKLMTPILQAGA